jgi:SulP family sulfate permease
MLATRGIAHAWLYTIFPFLRWWPGVNRETLRADIMAGLSGAIIVVPQGVAYATIAGLPPQYGLYAAMVPAIIAAMFGSSWHLVSGPTAAISIVVFSTGSQLAEPGSANYVSLVLTLTFLAGAFQLAMGLARMGALVNFISHSVVIGFTAGAALLIAASQLKNFFGLHIQSGASFFETLNQFVSQLDGINPYVASVGLVTIISGILAKRYWPKIPYMIAGMVTGSLAAILLDSFVGNATTGIVTVGAIPAGLPPLSAPDLSLETISRISPAALAIAMLGLTEAVSIARAVALRSQQNIDGTQEFIGQGLSNIIGSFFSSYASSGSFTRSGVNYEAGARTPLACVFAAGFLTLVLLVAAPLAAYVPIAAMAAILFMVAYSLIDTKHIKSIIKTDRGESAVMFTTLIATLFVELEFAIYVGVLLSLMLFLKQTSRPLIRSAVPAPEEWSYHFIPREAQPECGQMKMIFIDGPIFFGAADHVRGSMLQIDELNPQHKHVLILAPGINFIDVAGMEMLVQEAKRRRAAGGALYFHRVNEPVMALLRKSGALQDIGEENIFPAGPGLIDAVYPRLDSEVCRRCKTRIFKQCQVRLPNGELRVSGLVPGEQ